MKFSDLRPGNRFLLNGKPIQLMLVDILRIQRFQMEELQSPYEPEVITEDFVKRGGFRKKGTQGNCTTYYKPAEGIDGSHWEIVFIGKDLYAVGISHQPGICAYFAYHLKYCYELQNLWYATTKTEFIKP